MATFIRALIVAGIEVPLDAAHELEHGYESLARSEIVPMSDGSHIIETLDGSQDKLKVTIRGRGTVPVGLQGVAFDGPVLIKCAGPRAITSASRVITLPAARRSDVGSEPYGRAYVGGEWVSTPVSPAGNIYTLDEVANAKHYQCVYFPEILAVIEGGGVIESRSRGSNSTWSMTCWEA